MNCDPNQRDKTLDALTFPLRNADKILATHSARKQIDSIESSAHCIYECSRECHRSEIAFMKNGQANISAVRVPPCFTREERGGYRSLTMVVAEERGACNHRNYLRKMEPGGIYLEAGTGGRIGRSYFSGILWDIEQKRLGRTMRSMRVIDDQWNPIDPYTLQEGGAQNAHETQSPLWAFVTFVDQLLGESIYLPESLGLDEQVYRLLAQALFNSEGLQGKAQKNWEASTKQWTDIFDDLVDYIRSNAHMNLTLTDLEEQSHYSGRHLQNMFKEKFDCTPMQFVRRQRLFAAMEKLQTADPDDTATTIARDMGYRYTSNYSYDLQREFGVTPTVVLRSSRGGVR
jgi:AraC-like DNA-binding protein